MLLEPRFYFEWAGRVLNHADIDSGRNTACTDTAPGAIWLERMKMRIDIIDTVVASTACIAVLHAA